MKKKDKNNLNLIIIIFELFVIVLVSSFMPQRQVLIKKSTFGNASISLVPSTGSFIVGSTFPVDIVINNPEQKKISFSDIRLNFDQTKLQLVSFFPNDLFPYNITENNSELLGNNNGSARLTAANSGSNLGSSTAITFGRMILRCSQTGPGIVNIDVTNTQLVGEGTGNDVVLTLTVGQNGSYEITENQTPLPSPTLTTTPTPVILPMPTVTPSPSPTITPTPTLLPTPTSTPRIWINFSVKFQGIGATRSNQVVKVKLSKAGGENETTETTLTATGSGIYSGRAGFRTIQPGNDLMFFVKGPKHLSRRFCITYETERCLGNHYLTVNDNENYLDFTKVYLEAGDLPNPNDNRRQDGVVNSVDFVLVRNRLGSTNQGDLEVADLNLDGEVNVHDLILLRNTLETRYEEE